MAGSVVLASCSGLAIDQQQSIAKNSFVWQPFFSAELSRAVPFQWLFCFLMMKQVAHICFQKRSKILNLASL